jgi:hypothetical protein
MVLSHCSSFRSRHESRQIIFCYASALWILLPGPRQPPNPSSSVRRGYSVKEVIPTPDSSTSNDTPPFDLHEDRRKFFGNTLFEPFPRIDRFRLRWADLTSSAYPSSLETIVAQSRRRMLFRRGLLFSRLRPKPGAGRASQLGLRAGCRK